MDIHDLRNAALAQAARDESDRSRAGGGAWEYGPPLASAIISRAKLYLAFLQGSEPKPRSRKAK
jgi:hypothetical protein